jgi:hypothetical protein
MLKRMAQYPQKGTPVVSGNEGNSEIASSPANRQDCEKSRLRIIRRASRREEQTRGGRQGNQGRCDQRPRAPQLEQLQEFRHSALLEFAVQVGRAGPTRDPESKVPSKYGPCGGTRRVFVPERMMACGENGENDVEPPKSGDGRAIQNRQQEQPCSAQVNQGSEQSAMGGGSMAGRNDVQHLWNISTQRLRPALWPNRHFIPSG